MQSKQLKNSLILAFLFVFCCEPAFAQPFFQSVRLDNASNTTQTLDIDGVYRLGGTSTALTLHELRIETTGAATTVTFALYSRACWSAEGVITCLGWDTVALASGSLTPGMTPIELDRLRYQYRLVLTVTVGVPTTIRVVGLYW